MENKEIEKYKQVIDTLQKDVLHAKTIFNMGKSIFNIVKSFPDRKFIDVNYGLFLEKTIVSYNSEISLILTRLFEDEGGILQELHKPIRTRSLKPFDKDSLHKSAENYFLNDEDLKKLYDSKSLVYMVQMFQGEKTEDEISRIRINTLKEKGLPTNKYECLEFKKKELKVLYKKIKNKIVEKDSEKGGLVVLRKNGKNITLRTYRNQLLAHHDKNHYDINKWFSVVFIFKNPEAENLLNLILEYLNKYNGLFFNSSYEFNILTKNNGNNIELKFLRDKFESDFEEYKKFQERLKSKK